MFSQNDDGTGYVVTNTATETVAMWSTRCAAAVRATIPWLLAFLDGTYLRFGCTKKLTYTDPRQWQKGMSQSNCKHCMHCFIHQYSSVGLLRVLEYSSTTRVVNYSSIFFYYSSTR